MLRYARLRGNKGPDGCKAAAGGRRCARQQFTTTSQRPKGEYTTRHSFGLRAALIALTVALTGLGLSSSARADGGMIRSAC